MSVDSVFIPLCLLDEGKGSDGALADGFHVFLAEVGVAFADDLGHADLCGLLRDRVFAIKETFADGFLVLHHGGDDIVEVVATDAGSFGAHFFEAGKFDVDATVGFVDADVGSVRLVAVAVVEAILWAGIARGEVELGGEDLLHQERGGDGF